jgi:hypothetical protein
MSAPTTFNTKPLQIGLTLAFLIGGGGQAVYRALSLDGIGPNGRRCVVSASGKEFDEANRGIIPPGFNVFDPIIYPNSYIECKISDNEIILGLRLHPTASIIGTIVPYVLLSPFAYWLFGFSIKRICAQSVAAAARYKTCSYCSESIKAEAKVCRHCGRDMPA